MGDMKYQQVVVCAVLGVNAVVAVQAQTPAAGTVQYPVKLVRLITGSTAGGAADITA